MNNRHPIYVTHPPIFDELTNTLKIPLFDKDDKVIDWTIIDVGYESTVLQFRFHRITDKKIYKDNYYAGSNFIGLLHHIIIGKPEKGFVVDHINGNGLDNTKKNLRFANHSQNRQNVAKKEGCSSIYIGVTLMYNGKFRVTIKINSISTDLEIYEDELFAAAVYDAYAIKFYGIHARTNNMLSSDIKEWIIANDDIPEKYKKVKKTRTLPKCIIMCRGKFRVLVRRNGETFCKTVSTLEKAIKLRDEFIAKHESRCQTDELERINNPTKNANGEYIIQVQSKGKMTEVIVDAHVWVDVSKYAWCVADNYFSAIIDKKKVSMHRYIYAKYVLNGDIPDDMTVDHKNPNAKFDNRLSNLRLANKSLQSHNQNKHSDADPLNKYKGVSFDGSRFRVTIKGHECSGFKTEEEAALRANEIFTELYGIDAHLNVIDTTKTTKPNDKIQSDDITKAYVENIKTCFHLKAVINKKKLGCAQGGTIATTKIRKSNLEETKKKVIKLLFEQ